MRILTISREFGSGGRELGKRVADLLQIAYYDKEIVAAIAQKNQLDEGYVESIIDKGLSRSFPITIGRTFSYAAHIQNYETKVLVDGQRIIKELAAKGDCVMMGQSADVILREHHPLNLFVYADLAAKMARCQARAEQGEALSESELKKKIKQVDAGRARRHELLSHQKWGAKESYHLCVNTTGLEIKSLAPQIAEYAKYWFALEKS